MDPDKEQERLDELGEHIDEAKRELSDFLDPHPKETFINPSPAGTGESGPRSDDEDEGIGNPTA